MRLYDQPLPTVGGDRPGASSPVAGWPVDLYVTLGRLPVAAYQWDDYQAVWDDIDTRFEWDDIVNWPFDRIDATCDVQGLDITVGSPDSEGQLASGAANVTLDNRDGDWSQYDQRGRLVGYGPGVPLDIWAVTEDEPWWLFRGRIAGWHELPDNIVELEAFDAFSDLNQDWGLEWTPGTYGQKPGARIAAVLDLIGDDAPRRLDVGRVTLHNFASTASPLEEIQSVAVSDGGVFGCDVDGTIIYRDRHWLGGRADQVEVRVFSDNVCDT